MHSEFKQQNKSICQMKSRRRKEKVQTRVQFKEFRGMNNRLHQMLRCLGQEEVVNGAIKLDEFQRLRIEFVRRAEQLERSNNMIEVQSDQVERAKLLFSIKDSQMVMENNLKQMTTLLMKLNQKVKREKKEFQEAKTKGKGKKQEKYYQVEPEEVKEEMTPLEKELQYKTLILYTLEKNYFKLVKKESKQVEYTRRDLNNKKYQSLEDFKRQNPQIDRLLEKEHEETLEERQILEALKKIDNLIEQRMDKILEGIRLMNYNAINISQGLDNIHKQILINLDKVQHNEQNLKENQKRLEEAAKVVTKPNCICNVIIAVLLGLIGFLVVKLVWFSG